MDEPSLQELILTLRSLGSDHSTCEVKRAQGGIPATLWESITAFANAEGGIVVLGVDEKHGFDIVGVNDAGAVEAAIGAICSELEPPIRADISTVSIGQKNVVVIAVPKLPRDRRPCYKRSLGPWAGSRYRVADGDRKLTDYEVSLLLANRKEQNHDLRPIVQARKTDLDADSLQAFLGRVREIKATIFSRIPDDDVLRMMNIIVDHEGEMVPTLAGLLAFGIYPQQFEPQLDITFISFPTPTPGELGPRGERFTENQSIDGSIPVMAKECIRILKRNMRRRSIVTGFFRTDEWEYPEEVLREALTNALVHRDYSETARGMQVQVEMYPDRLVVRNPGGLYGPVDVDSLGTSNASSTRNRALLKILEDTPLAGGHMMCENRGSGIARMRFVMSEAGMEPPTFRDLISTFEAEFPNHTLVDQEAIEWLGSLSGEPLSRAQMTALVIMRQGKPLTNSGYRAATGVGDSRTASKELKDLVERGLVVQFGTRGGTSYSLMPTDPHEAERLHVLPGAELRSSFPDPAETLPTIQRQVYEAIGHQPISRAAINAATGLESAQVSTALLALKDKGLVGLVGKQRSKNALWIRRTEASGSTSLS
jgi:ATP-dependent DNA helicase RecG